MLCLFSTVCKYIQQILVLNLVLHKGCDAAVSLINSYSEYILRCAKKYVRFHTMD
ncbi:hypothetical protein KsCSTR_37530 [Candidatus Kuenenia stuttgartiensis]|uniref:Uncharacterized protein n=1 Tax=Kuenenia stuttgartiensis TaxID=174633 RepID=Q1Q676_KUEST|nr:hypothetical protein KsCSTR_37530 [Candidatus Kuenenia stuttgartiensis]CAJ73069.1 unknown protein [Candidatus Kuenenia stuttgartiensis]